MVRTQEAAIPADLVLTRLGTEADQLKEVQAARKREMAMAEDEDDVPFTISGDEAGGGDIEITADQ
jgi:hypothetical protein